MVESLGENVHIGHTKKHRIFLINYALNKITNSKDESGFLKQAKVDVTLAWSPTTLTNLTVEQIRI